jgi:hypothetical protein
MPADPTDADRAAAWELVRASYEPMPDEALRDRIAAALADERERARAPFLALADKLEAQGNGWRAIAARDPWPSAMAAALRHAAQEPTR